MRIRLSRSIIPNLFTVLNIYFGFLCIVYAFHGRYMLAGMYVILSALCDTLDGIMARLTHSASEFGVELDSLADVVSFGAAPSVLVYQLFLRDLGPFGMLLAAAQLIFGALRLARFNVQLTGLHKEYFTGVPIPLSALTIVSFMFFFTPAAIDPASASDPTLRHVFIGVIISCGLLMVSTLRYPVLPKPGLRMLREHPIRALIFLAAAAAAAVFQEKALFPIFAAIVLSGIVRAAVVRIGGGARRRHSQKESEAGSPVPLDTNP